MSKNIVIAALTLGILVTFTDHSNGCVYPPIANITGDPCFAVVGQAITLDGSTSVANCSGGSINSWEWDPNYNGTTFNSCYTGSVVNHTYTIPGIYTVALRVKDNCTDVPGIGYFKVYIGSAERTRVFYVKEGAAGSGTSWENALGDINSALVAAQSNGGGQIWVSQGTYIPSKRTNPSDSRSATFPLVNGVGLYGGFSGSETTMLSENFNDGDFNDWAIVNDYGQGSWSASSGKMVQRNMVGSSNDGIAQRGTYAWYQNGLEWEDYRVNATLQSSGYDSIGIMFRYQDVNNYYRFSMGLCYKKRLLIKKVAGTVTLLAGDSVTRAQGRSYNTEITAQGSTLKVVVDGNVIFSVIDDSLAKGSVALYSYIDSNSTFDNIEVTDCKRDINAYPTVLSGDLDYNDVGDSNRSENAYHVVTGSDTDSTAVLDGFAIIAGNANGADPYNLGGGICNYYGGPSVSNCRFQHNSASYKGGAMYNHGSPSPIVKNCTFKNNRTTGYGGGAIFNRATINPIFINCVISDNTGTSGAGVYNLAGSNPTFINCSILYNNGSGSGGGICNNSSIATVTNCVIWGNEAVGVSQLERQIYPAPTSQAIQDFTYSCIEGLSALGMGNMNIGNIDDDPNFVSSGTGDYRLQAGSPCVDIGDNNAVPQGITTDINGIPRILDGNDDNLAVVDMGAYEYVMPDNNNTPPEANAGADQVLSICSGNSIWVTLDGSDSNDVDSNNPPYNDSDIVSYEWSWSGAVRATGEVNQVLMNTSGSPYSVTLKVRDSAGNESTDTLQITIVASGAPVANPGDNVEVQAVNGVADVVLDGSSSTGADLTYIWYSGGVEIARGATPQVRFGIGVTTVGLLVIDGCGNSNYAETTVTVRWPSVGAQIEAGEPQVVYLPLTGSLHLHGRDAVELDPCNEIQQYEWKVIAVPQNGYVESWPYGKTVLEPNVILADGVTGEYVFMLTGKNSAGNEVDTDTTTITVSAFNLRPEVIAWILDGNVKKKELTVTSSATLVTLQGLITDDGRLSGQLTAKWKQLSGPIGGASISPLTENCDNRCTELNVEAEATFTKDGTYQLYLEGIDGTLDKSDVVVVNYDSGQPPFVEAGRHHSAVLEDGHADVNMSDAYVTDRDLPFGNVDKLWELIDGNSANIEFLDTNGQTSPLERPTIRFTQKGSYTFRLTATDPLVTGEVNDTVYVVVSEDPINKSFEWPMYHHDFASSGYSDSTAPDTCNVLWEYQAGSNIYSSPAIVDGVLYIGCNDAKLYAINAFTGDLLWRFRADAPIHSSPAVDNGKVYFFSDVGTLYAVDVTNHRLVWSVGLCPGSQNPCDVSCDYSWSSPVVHNGNVFVASSDGYLNSRNANTGDENWRTLIGGMPNGPVTVFNGKVYCGTHTNNPILIVLDETDGHKLWEYKGYSAEHPEDPVNGFIASNGVSVADGDGDMDLEVYFGVTRNVPQNGYEAYYGWVVCLNESGDKQWSREVTYSPEITNSGVPSTPAVHNGKIYIGANGCDDSDGLCLGRDGGLIILDANEPGNILDFIPVTGGTCQAVVCAPAVADGKVFFGAENHYVYAINEITHNEIWKFYTGSSSKILASPAVAYGNLYIADEGGKIFAFNSSEMELEAVDNVSGEICPGAAFTYTISYNYPSGSSGGDLSGVKIVDSLPIGFEYVSSSPEGTYDAARRTVTWPVATLSPGQYGDVYVTVEVTDKAEPNSAVTNNAVIWCSNGAASAKADTNTCCFGPEVIYVDNKATGSNHGTSWEDAYMDLQDALERAKNGCGSEIWVAASSIPYMPGGFSDSNFSMVPDVNMYGGFAGTELSLEERNLSIPGQQTVLSGNSGLINYIVMGADNTTLDGFTITGARVAGIGCEMVSPTVSHCVITGNVGEVSASDPREGIRISWSSPVIVNCIISNNSGYGISIYNGVSPVIRNDTIIENGLYGIYNDYATQSVYNCLLWNNSRSVSEPNRYLYQQSGCTLYNCFVEGSPYTKNNRDLYGSFGGTYPFGLLYGHLKLDADCIDTGNSSAAINDKTDIDGQARIIGAAVDIGADEFTFIWVEAGDAIHEKIPVGSSSVRVDFTSASVMSSGDGYVPANLTYQWSNIPVAGEPTPSSLTNSADLYASATFYAEGWYLFKLQVKNGSVVMGTDLLWVRIDIGVGIVVNGKSPVSSIGDVVTYEADVNESLGLSVVFGPQNYTPYAIEWSAPVTIENPAQINTNVNFDIPGRYLLELYALNENNEVIGKDRVWIDVKYPMIEVSAGPDRTLYLEKNGDVWRVADNFNGFVDGIDIAGTDRVEWSVQAATDNADLTAVSVVPDSASPMMANISFGHNGAYYILFSAWKNTSEGEYFLGTGVAVATVMYRQVTVSAGDYTDSDVDGYGDTKVDFTSVPGTINLHGEVTMGEVDSVEWVFDAPGVPEGLVTFASPRNLNTMVTFNAVIDTNPPYTAYSGAGTYAITLLGKIRINGEDVVVASDTVNIEVTVPPGGGTSFEKSICITTENGEASGYSMPLTTQVWAAITEGDCNSGLPFTGYDSAVWSWNGTDNSVVIHQPDPGIPQADVTVNRVGDYVLTLVVKNGESLIATASHTLSFDQVEIDAGNYYPDNDGDGDGDVELTFLSAPGTFHLHGAITKGQVDSVAWVFLDPCAPPNLVTFSDYTNLNTEVTFNAVDGYSGAGTYAITLLGKRKIDGGDVVVASDTINIEVAIPGGGTSFEKTLCIRTANDEASGHSMPLTTQVWATITEGDCYNGTTFEDYDYAVWSWSGKDDSLVIHQADQSIPQANVTVNRPGDYTLTLVVKKGDSLIGTVSHQISFKDARVEILTSHPNCFVDSNAAINLYGRVIQGDIDSVEWAFLAPDAPDGLVTFVNPTNLEAEVTFSIGGIYPITLLGKSNIGEQEVIVASDTVYFVVDQDNISFQEAICVSTSNSEPNGTVLPFTLQVNATMETGECGSGQYFQGYDSAVWSWSGTDGSVVINQASQSNPQAEVTFNKPGEYALTLEVKKAGSLIGIASHPITITGTETSCNISANAGFDESMNEKLRDIALGSTATLFGEITNTCTTQIEYYWSCGNPSNAVDLTPVASADPCKVPVNVTFTEPGDYPFTLCIVDKQTRELLATSGTIFASVAPPLYWLDISGEQIVRWDSSLLTASSTLNAAISGGAPAGSTCTWSTTDSNVILPNPATVDSGVPVTIGFTSLGYHDINVTGNVSNPAWSGTSTVTIYVTEEVGGIDTVVYNAGSAKYITLPDLAYMSDAAFITNDPNHLVPRWSLDSGPSGAEVTFLPNENSEKPYVAFSKSGHYKLKLVPWNLYTQAQIPDTNADTVDVFVSVPVIQNLDAPEVTLQVQNISGTSKLLTATANDEDGVMQLQIELGDDGDSIVLERTSGAPAYNQTLTLQYTLDVSILPAGASSIRARAWDISGNMGQSTPDVNFTNDSDINYFHVTPETINNSTGSILTYAAEFGSEKMWTVDIYRQGEGEVDTNEGTNINFEKTINTAGWPDGDYSAVLRIGYETPEDETDDETREVRFRILRGQVSSSDVIAELRRFKNTDIASGLGEIPRGADYRPPILVIREGRGNIYANIGSNKFPNDVEYRLLICTGGSGSGLVPIQIITPSDVPHNSQGWARRVSDGNAVEDLGSIDLSMLENGSYYMMLSVRCNGVIRDDSVQFILDCPLKIGNVKFSQEDLVVETGGIPLRVVRTYDSLRKHKQGEFGYGWTYSIANLDVALDETRVPMYSSDLTDLRYDWGTTPTRVGDNITNRNVTLTLPDGRRTTFMFYLEFHGNSPDGGLPYYTAEYAPMDGIDAELVAKAYNSSIDTANKREVLCGNIIDGSTYWEAVGLAWDSVTHTDASMYDFYSYILTTGDGTEYYFERDLKSKNYYGTADYMCPPNSNPHDAYYTIVRGPLYLTRIKAKNGEEVVLNPDLATGRIGAAGIEFKDAQGTQSSKKLQVGYDGSGRISYIDAPSDANTGTHTLIYVYDEPTGNLTQVKKLVNKNGATEEDKYDITYYSYEDGTHEPADHFVTDIKDERGLTPIRYVYDAAGRLTETIDAKGNHITIEHNVTGKTEVVYERWDMEKEYPAIYGYNDRGDVNYIRKYDNSGSPVLLDETQYVYDAGSDNPREIIKSVPNPDNPSQEVTAITYYEYDQYGKPTLTADPENNVTKTTYDRFGNVTEVIQGMNYNQSNGNYTAVSRTANTYEGSNLKTTSVWDPNNNNKPMSMSVNVYDSRNRIRHTINVNLDAVADVSAFYTLTFNPVADTIRSDYEASHSVTTYSYNGSELQPQSVQDPAGAVTHFAYDENGNQNMSWYYWVDPYNAANNCNVYTVTIYDDAGRVIETQREVGDVHGNIAPSTVTLSQTTYNSVGKVDTSINELGIATKYFYDEIGNLVETDTYDPNGNLLTVSRTLYDTEGRAIVSVGPYEPNVYDRPIVEWPVGTETVYDALGRAAQTRRWAGVKVDLMPFKVIKPSGQTVPCLISDSDMAGKMVPVGVIPKHAWDGTGNQPGLNSIGWTSDNNLPVVKFTLAASGEIGPLSYSRTVYDIGGRVKHSIGLDESGDEQITTYQYDKAGKQTVVIDPCGHAVSRTQEITLHSGLRASQINLNSITYNNTYRTDTHYDGTRRDYVIDACDNTTHFTYDALGRVIKTTYPPAKTGDPNTYVYVGYDGFGRKAWESKQTTKTFEQLTAQDAKEYEYDAAGRLSAAILPEIEDIENGNAPTRPRYEYKYDAYGNQIEIWDKLKENPVTFDVNYAGKRVTKFTYDHLNNQISRELPGGAKEYKEYDDLGRIYFAMDFKGQVTGFEYDSQGRLEYKKYYANETRYDANDPCETVRYTYDNLGRRKQVSEARGTTTYEYDAEGNIEEVNSPDGVVNYGYDPVTSRKSATSTANTETQFDYDAMGRLKDTKLVKRNGGSVSELTTYEYTPTGSRSKMLLPNGVTTNYSYDNLNRLLDVTHTKTSQLSKYEYTLATDGMRQQLTEDISTGGGRTVNYTYDNLNRVLTESAAADSNSYDIEYTYDVAGNRTKRTISANGQCMQTDYVYNDRDELAKETHIDPGVCAYLNDKPVYAYTSNGQITNYRLYGSSKDISPFRAYLLGIPSKWSDYATTTVLGLLPITFLLPVFARIIRRGGRRAMPLLRQCLIVLLAYLMLLNPSWVEQNAQAAIDYSNLGTANWGTTNRDIHYYYDENGSCVKKIEAVKDTADPDTTFVNKTLYTYDLRNQLTKVEYTTDGTTWDTTTYKYNDDGIRVEKNDNGTVTQYLVDSHNHTGYAQVLEERTGGTLTKTCIIGDDCIGDVDNSNTLKYYLYDGQGSVRHHSNSTGGLVSYNSCDTFAYDAYGQRVDQLKDTVNNGLFYTGEQWDNSAQMYYLRARYYDPLNGRFNQMDSFAGNNQDPQSLHKYLYCHANPVNGIDPSGEFGLIGFTLQVLNVMGIISTVMGFTLKTVAIGMGLKQLSALNDFTIELFRAPIPDLVTKIMIQNLVGVLAIKTVGQILEAGTDIIQSAIVLLAFSILFRATLGFLRDMSEATKLANAAMARVPITDVSKLLPKMHKHHIFPQDPKFAQYWKNAQIKINDYTVEIERTTHLRGVHGKGLMELPGRWNARWNQFFTDNPGATSIQIFRQAGMMMDEFGLSDLPIVPY